MVCDSLVIESVGMHSSSLAATPPLIIADELEFKTEEAINVSPAGRIFVHNSSISPEIISVTIGENSNPIGNISNSISNINDPNDAGSLPLSFSSGTSPVDLSTHHTTAEKQSQKTNTCRSLPANSDPAGHPKPSDHVSNCEGNHVSNHERQPDNEIIAANDTQLDRKPDRLSDFTNAPACSSYVMSQRHIKQSNRKRKKLQFSSDKENCIPMPEKYIKMEENTITVDNPRVPFHNITNVNMGVHNVSHQNHIGDANKYLIKHVNNLNSRLNNPNNIHLNNQIPPLLSTLNYSAIAQSNQQPPPVASTSKYPNNNTQPVQNNLGHNTPPLPLVQLNNRFNVLNLPNNNARPNIQSSTIWRPYF